MPIKAQGKASLKNSCSISTASVMICKTRCLDGWLRRRENNKQAKSVCKPSSREISSLLKVKPGMRPRFLSQKIDANDPEKKIPSTAAKAIKRSAKESLLEINLKAHAAFLVIQGTDRKKKSETSDVSNVFVVIQRLITDPPSQEGGMVRRFHVAVVRATGEKAWFACYMHRASLSQTTR